ncbi:type VI secretion system Vgr family protein [Tropicimonas sp.]|uniref:type VI secretion system Vgr family protein n=1 Tax=Tropicimonas sp. TaxID=2067044 RepID=UPI003A8B1323
MSAKPPNAADYPIRMECCWPQTEVFLVAAKIGEKLGRPTETTIEFVANNRTIDLNEIVGTTVRLKLGKRQAENAPDTERAFAGLCVSAGFLGEHAGLAHFTAELRPPVWMLSLSRNSRVFQDMTAPEIVKQVLGEYGLSGDITDKLSDSYPVRGLCVQYRESDLDFLHRLMEEEGIYYFMTPDEPDGKLVLADDAGAHDPVEGGGVPFIDLESRNRRQLEHLFEWDSSQRVTTGKVTLNDYNFLTPRADLKSLVSIATGTHQRREIEAYEYPGHYGDTGDGDRYARIRMEQNALRYRQWSGAGNASVIAIGGTFTLEDAPRKEDGTEFMVTQATHYLQLDPKSAEALGVSKVTDAAILFGDDNQDPYRVRLNAVPKGVPYRSPMRTPWPEVAGVHSAVVTGPAGEEIHTDKYGRIRIQFQWDRDGKRDENSTCWARCMMPWTGKNWGMIALPRVGQEVVVQFEEGNPDRPLIVGMVYNADTMPPYALPGNKTQSGIKTRSSKSGTTDNFNELRFEDKKGGEEIYFHAERDFTQVVENDARIDVGLDKKDKGDMALTVHRHLDETLRTGDHTFTVEDGNQTISISKDQTETVEGKLTQTVTGNVTGKVRQGNRSWTLDSGNESLTISKGDYSVKTSLGKITMEAMQSIEFKVGGNSVKIDQTGVTIKGTMIRISAQAMLKASAAMTRVSGSGIVIVQGGLIKIN